MEKLTSMPEIKINFNVLYPVNTLEMNLLCLGIHNCNDFLRIMIIFYGLFTPPTVRRECNLRVDEFLTPTFAPVNWMKIP